MARPEKVRLGEILVEQKLLTEEQLADTLDEQKRSGRRLGRLFIEKRFVTEEQISEALSRQLKIPYINLKQFNVKPDLMQMLPEARARRFRAIVLADDGKSVKIGMADPTDLNAYDQIARLLRRDCVWVVTESQLLATIDRFIDEPSNTDLTQNWRPSSPMWRSIRVARDSAGPRSAGRQAQTILKTLRRCAPPTFTSSRRSAGCISNSHRRRAAFADRGRLSYRRSGAAPEAHIGPDIGETPASGQPLNVKCARRKLMCGYLMPTQYGERW